MKEDVNIEELKEETRESRRLLEQEQEELAERTEHVKVLSLLALFGEGEVNLLHAVAVDGAEVVAHGDDVVACVAPLLAQRESLFAVGMVAVFIVGYEHEGCGAMILVAQAEVVHGLVAAAVAKRQHGHLSYLLNDLQYLVGFQVLDE